MNNTECTAVFYDELNTCRGESLFRTLIARRTATTCESDVVGLYSPGTSSTSLKVRAGNHAARHKIAVDCHLPFRNVGSVGLRVLGDALLPELYVLTSNREVRLDDNRRILYFSCIRQIVMSGASRVAGGSQGREEQLPLTPGPFPFLAAP